jgi:DNA-binding SARP family transcriptional activator
MVIVRSRIRPPGLGDRVVGRPRLQRLISELSRSYGIVWVTGTAGSGKTTSVLEAATADGRPLAWLTLDTADQASGHLLTYLEAALRSVAALDGPAVTDALADGVPHVEAAGLLAESLGGDEVTLVLDDLDRLSDSPEARTVLSAFLRYAPSSLASILVARQRLSLDLGSARKLHGVGSVDEVDLAFTVDEAAAALELMGRPPQEADAAVDATRGWVAGVLFEAWRSADHMHGAGGETDPLSGYLSSEIMENLADAERRFLISTSLLEEVTPARAELLGQERSGELMAALSSARIPASFSNDGLTMRCHPRFREYLQERLRRGNPAEVRAMRRAYGELLAAEGQYEEAVEELLSANATDAAERAAVGAISSVVRRGDFSVAERWLNAFRRESVEASLELTSAEVLLALEREEFGRGALFADRLIAMTETGDASSLNPDIACEIAWCYYLVARVDDARALLEVAPASAQTAAMRFAIAVPWVNDPMHYRDRPTDTGSSVDGLLARVDLSHGRFSRLLDYSSSGTWGAIRSSRIGALRASGRLDEALALCRESPFDNWTIVSIYVELMADLERPEEAWSALARSRTLLARTGSPIQQMLDRLTEAMLALRLRGDTAAATAALNEVARNPIAFEHLRIAEQLETWRGLAALLDDDAPLAIEHLRRATELMTEWDRLPNLAVAAIYLAEAAWRTGDEDGADAAADLALDAARRQGSNHLLVRTLREFPAVLSRRLDAEPDPDSAWHDLGRTLMADGLTKGPSLEARIYVREFGHPELIVDGNAVEPKLTKSVELLAYLAVRGGGAPKGDLLSTLFESSPEDSARSYLRSALSSLRQVLPDDAPLTANGEFVRWAGETLSTESLVLQGELQQALSLRGTARLNAIIRALAVFERGEYLPGTRSAWAADRREELRTLANDALHAAGETAFELGQYGVAEGMLRRVLEDEPYRETSWRLSMRIAGALGQGDLVISRFRACEASLAKLSTAPSDSTRKLLEQLRR